MSISARSSARLAGILAGAAVLGLSLVGGASAAFAKNGSTGYEYLCMDTDTDPGCWQTNAPSGGGGWAPQLGWSMDMVGLTESDRLPNGTEVLRYDTLSGLPATEPMRKDMAAALNMICDNSGATVFCR